MGLKEYLFGNLDEVFVTIEPEKADAAEQIFEKYSARKILREDVERSHEGPVKILELGSEHPNKTLLVYLLDRSSFSSVFDELYEADIAGNSRHNKVFSRPYSIRRKAEKKIEEIVLYVRGH
jgi:hypothetical protein